MNNAFGVMPHTVYEISDWHQLTTVPSDIENLKCSVMDIKDDICKGTSVTVYNKDNGIKYITFFVSGTDIGIVEANKLVLSENQVSELLKVFGFNVTLIAKFNLDDTTKKALRMYYNLGYKFICRNNKGEIFVSQFDTQDIIYKSGTNVKDSPISKDCDFSFLPPSHVYAILTLIR